MRSWASTATVLLGSTIIGYSTSVISTPVDPGFSHASGFVDDIKLCPALRAKENPRNIHHMYAFRLLCKALIVLPLTRQPFLSDVQMTLQSSWRLETLSQPASLRVPQIYPDTTTPTRIRRIRNRSRIPITRQGTMVDRSISYLDSKSIGEEVMPRERIWKL